MTHFSPYNRRKTPEKYTKLFFPSLGICGGHGKSFTVVEANAAQIVNVTLLYGELLKSKYMPIFESEKVVEQYPKSK